MLLMPSSLFLLIVFFFSQILAQLPVWVQLEAGASYVCQSDGNYKEQLKDYKIKIKSFDFEPIYERYPDGFVYTRGSSSSNTSYRTIVCGSLQEHACPFGDNGNKQWSTEQINKVNGNCIRGLSDWSSYCFEQENQCNSLNLYALIMQPGDKAEDSYLTGFEIRIINTNALYEANLTCPNNRMTTNYNIRCDNSSSDTFVRGVSENFENCEWNISFVSPYGCASWSHYDTSSSNNNNKLSGGSIFIIILFVVSTIYIVIGCIYNSFKHGRVGMEACPNKQSWDSCCRYTKVGCLVTFDCITCSKGRASYTAI